MSGLSTFRNFTDGLKEEEKRMPFLFIGHGSPMNGIEDNEFSQRWKAMAREIPIPKAVLVVSAHWFTRGTHITAMEHPETIHDFGGFPKALFEVKYRGSGAGEGNCLSDSAGTGLVITRLGSGSWCLDRCPPYVSRSNYPGFAIEH